MRRTHRWLKIPVLMAGIFCVCPTLSGNELLLQLFEDDQFMEAQREARRVLLTHPQDAVAATLYGLAKINNGNASEEDIVALSALAEETDDPEQTAMIHLSLAHYFSDQRDIPQAVHSLTTALASTHNPDVFHLACATLDALKWDQTEAVALITPELQAILDTSRPEWTADLRRRAAAIRSDSTSSSVFSLPGQWVVRFYRAQISPAIGRRCSLHPSCSEFFKQASEEYGLKGIPMLGDRLVREPGIVSEGKHPVAVGPYILYADPLRKHHH